MGTEPTKPVRFVNARELGRRTGELLDAVIDGTRLGVTRHGIPIAVIDASEQVALRQRLNQRASLEPFEEDEEVDLDSFGLPEDVWPVLEAYSRLESVDSTARVTGLSVGEVSIALVKTEIEKLTSRLGARLVLNDLGERALKAWRERD